MRTIADLQRMAVASGCTLISTRLVGGELVGEFDCPDASEGAPFATALLLGALTSSDQDSFDPALVLSIRSAGNLAPVAAHAYVQSRVKFAEDSYQGQSVEVFAAPGPTLASGEGDCDDSARVLVRLAAACGIPARLVFFLQQGTPAHVCAQLWSGGAWQWAETTIPADFGEDPIVAAVRLGMPRPDLDGTPVVFEHGVAVPLTKGMGRMGRRMSLADAGRVPRRTMRGTTMSLADAGRVPRRTMRGTTMRGMQVPRVATPVTAQELLNALAQAWPNVVGGDPGQALQILVAQSAFETAAWAAVWNYNLGNVKLGGASTDWFSMTASEGSGATATMQASQWRSYSTLADGAAAWLQVLASGYSTALASAESGDVSGFVSNLKSGGYFTGDESQYEAGVERYYAQYSSLTPTGGSGGGGGGSGGGGLSNPLGTGVSGIGVGGAVAVLAVALVAGVVVGSVSV